MLNISPAFKKKLYNDERDYINRLAITLADGTELTVDNEHIMGSGGVEIDDAVSEDDSFSALGSTVINSVTFVLYNNDEIYSDYDFKNAKIIYYTGLNVETTVNDQTTTVLEEIRKGTFTVDDATYGQATITLYALDYMEQFDRPYSTSTLVYPATLAEIVRDACYHCLGSVNDLETQQFPHYTYSIPNRPSDEATTFREVVGYAAAVAGCFARCNVYGKLELKWFDTDTLYDTENDYNGGTFNPWTTGETISGGTFNPWTTGTVKDAGNFTSKRIPHYITALWSADIAVDDVVITGVTTTIEIPDPNDPQSTIDQKVIKGTDDYVVDIEDNPFITQANVDEILGWLQTQLVGLTFRKCNVSHQSDPSIEAGDIGYVWDTKGVEHPILITRATFVPSAPQTIVCGASTPSRNSATRFSQLTKSFVKNKKMMKQAQNPYAKALQDLAEAVNSATGMYETDVTESGATIHYRHNKPNLEQSDIVIKESSVGITFTTNYLEPNPVWYGFTVDGDVVAKLISALGINFEWAVGTTLTLGGANNGNGVLRVLDANGNLVGTWNNTGISLLLREATKIIHELKLTSFKYLTYGAIDAKMYEVTGYGLNFTRKNDDVIENQYSINQYNGDTKEIIYSKKSWRKEIFIGDAEGNGHWLNTYWSQYGFYSGGMNTGSPTESFPDFSINLLDFLVYLKRGSFRINRTSTDNASIEIKATSSNNTGDAEITVTDSYLDIQIGNEGSLIYDLYSQTGQSGYWYIKGDKRSGFIMVDSGSSKRFKHDISYNIDDELNPHKLYDLKLAQFVYNDDYKEIQYEDMRDKTIIGFIAEDVDEIYPNAVISKNGQVESWDERRLLPPMLALIQEQKKQIDEQQQKIESLEDRIEKLEALVNRLL